MTATAEATAQSTATPHTIKGLSETQFEALELVFSGESATAELLTVSGDAAIFADLTVAETLINNHREGLDKKTGFPGQQLKAVLNKIEKTRPAEKKPTAAELKAKTKESKAEVKANQDAKKRQEEIRREMAKEAEAKRKAEVEACEWIIVDRKRRYAEVVTQVWNLKHPECPESPKAFDKFGGDGPVFEWAAVCLEHDERGYYRRKDIAEANAADPWGFCTKCAEAMGETVNVAK
ncbi:hypothetical protein [Actinomadura litoris]|uniref:hypothetical protein n=1 Tax=Actinomadura litoris TaxID=2678616 RepID=UPI001FA70E4C|nr:hypothetical protein [Actinomadura litoris]